jgi:hypothetical protein
MGGADPAALTGQAATIPSARVASCDQELGEAVSHELQMPIELAAGLVFR